MTKILVIEDMPDSAEMTAVILRNYGYEVTLAYSGERGLLLAREIKPDLIVYDYWLPDIDARTFLKRLRSTEGLEQTKVVACTATPVETVLKVVGEDAFDGVIRKPFRVTGLLTAIESQLPS